MRCEEDIGAECVRQRGRRPGMWLTEGRWKNKRKQWWPWTLGGHGRLSQRVTRFCVLAACEPSGTMTQEKMTNAAESYNLLGSWSGNARGPNNAFSVPQERRLM